MDKTMILRKSKMVILLLDASRIIVTVMAYDRKDKPPIFIYRNDEGIMESEIAIHINKHLHRKNSKFKFLSEQGRIFVDGRKLIYTTYPRQFSKKRTDG